jgi:cell division protein FtsL
LATTPKNIGEIYAERALSGEPAVSAPPALPRPETDYSPLTSTGPVIYGGTTPGSSPQNEFVRQALAARNKPVARRRISPFNVMLTLIGAAIAIVLYIGNVIAVEQLLKEVADQQAKLQQILNDQEILKAQINRMSSLERIRKMAEDDLGLHNPNNPPQWIRVDGDRVRDVEEQLSSRQPTAGKTK